MLFTVSSRLVGLHEKTVSKELKTNSLEECLILQVKSSLLLFALFFHFQNEYIKISATNINHSSIFLSTNKMWCFLTLGEHAWGLWGSLCLLLSSLSHTSLSLCQVSFYKFYKNSKIFTKFFYSFLGRNISLPKPFHSPIYLLYFLQRAFP